MRLLGNNHLDAVAHGRRDLAFRVEHGGQAIARSGLRDAALRVQRRLTERVLARKDRGSAQARVSAWVAAAGKDLAHWQRTLADMRAAGASDFATLTVGVESVRKLAS